MSLIPSIFAMLVMAACTDSDPGVSAPTLDQARQTEMSPEPGQTGNESEVPADAQPDVELALQTQGNNLAYDQSELEVESGQIVRLTFRNGASPESSLFHNVVITRPGKEAEVANDGLQAGEGLGWFQDGPNVIAHVPMIGPGVSSSVVFRAPAPGDYPFICTYPGHASVMKGILKVR